MGSPSFHSLMFKKDTNELFINDVGFKVHLLVLQSPLSIIKSVCSFLF